MFNSRDIFYGIGVAATSPIWGLSLLRTGKWRTDWAGRLGRCDVPPAKPGQRTLLIHAVSVGEAALIRGLVDELAASDPQLRIVIASTTNTGFARAAAMYGQKHTVIRYPFDFSRAVGGVLDAVKPDLFATVELEVWPNFVEACDRRGIPVAVINGRLSEKSYRGYRRIRPLIGPTFEKLSRVAAQTEAYAERFRGMGVPADRVQVLDTMKWDTAVIEPASGIPGRDELANELGLDRDKPIVVAGSTGDGEEKLLIESGIAAFAQLVLVPRKPERFDAVAKIDPAIVRLTKRREAIANGDCPITGGRAAIARHGALGEGVFLIDTMGELRKAYALADVSVVGRSFNGWGGSDPMEPVALGLPTVIGPDHRNFVDAVAALEQGGGIVVDRDVTTAVRHLLEDHKKTDAMKQAGQAVIRTRQGSTRRHAAMILDMLRSCAEG